VRYTEAEFQTALAAALERHRDKIKPKPHPGRIGTGATSGRAPSSQQPVLSAVVGGLNEAPPETTKEIAKLWSILNYVRDDGARLFDPDCAEPPWSEVLMALAATHWECADKIGDKWSAQAKRPNRYAGYDVIQEKIEYFTRTGRAGLTERSLYRRAIDAGWEEPPLEEMLADAVAAGLIEPQTAAQSQTNRRSALVAQTATDQVPPGQSSASTVNAPDVLANLRWHDEAGEVDSPRWLMKNVLPEKGTALLSGQWGTGKTFVALELAACVTRGMPFANYKL
jgi:hypothetical protein